MATSLIVHGRIKTTLAKAKELRPFVEKLITKAVDTNLTTDYSKVAHLLRIIKRDIQNRDAQKVLIRVWGAHFIERPGGYTRIIKLPARLGDNASMAYIMMVLDMDLLEKYGFNDFGNSIAFLKSRLMQNIPQPLDLVKLWRINGIPELSILEDSRTEKSIASKITISVKKYQREYWPIFNGEYVKYPITVFVDTNDQVRVKTELSNDLIEVPMYKEDERLRVLYELPEKQQIQTIKILISTTSRRSKIKNKAIKVHVMGPGGLTITKNLNPNIHE